jgi:hypothetical protein
MVFERIWKTAHAAAGLAAPLLQTSQEPIGGIPFLSEPWYCCAEPTREQFVSLGQVPKKLQEAVPATGSYV